MENTHQLVAAAKNALAVKTDSEFSRRIGVSRQTVSNWKRGENCMDEKTAAELAELVEIDPRDAVIMVLAERAKTEKDRKFWLRLLSTKSALLAIMPAVYAVATVSVCILCKIAERLPRRCDALHTRASTA